MDQYCCIKSKLTPSSLITPSQLSSLKITPLYFLIYKVLLTIATTQ